MSIKIFQLNVFTALITTSACLMVYDTRCLLQFTTHRLFWLI